MDVKVFRTFLEVAKVKHFGRASENLYITQAAVSARIKQLESFFDTQLFIRDRNAIKLTSSGERLIAYAENMVRTLEQSKAELLLSKAHAIQLALAGTPNVWDAYLQHCLCVITDTFQGYAFSAESLGREHMHRALVERTLDIGVGLDQLKSDELVCSKVADLELVLVSTQQQNQLSALAKSYVYVDWGTRFSSEHASRHSKMPPPFLRTSTGRIALDFILEKGGASYLPASMVEPFIDSQQLFNVEEAEPWLQPVYLSYRKDSAALDQIKQVEKLLDKTEPSTAFILQQAAELPPADEA
ncbi:MULTISPECIES: LysR family transcriptional regulator [unclassified Agarivorans]|uniref:LysR family transcriptional regulator n=1 Tax=unclassified Agarivorans TaxID=2636026 RepID=UPI0026E1372A|nr:MULTISPECIES: LysR family transcriptional regulator [unclassified Agarivorans]MDO6686588.1 LysR family transcriptional regulator [Agarivorans sp. 3_MG-2023]MDO6715406.1 LysR family transcriptional regulator [Agarivorans sp. 2_MG-2023]